MWTPGGYDRVVEGWHVGTLCSWIFAPKPAVARTEDLGFEVDKLTIKQTMSILSLNQVTSLVERKRQGGHTESMTTQAMTTEILATLQIFAINLVFLLLGVSSLGNFAGAVLFPGRMRHCTVLRTDGFSIMTGICRSTSRCGAHARAARLYVAYF